MSQAIETIKGFHLGCPRCGDEEDSIFIYLSDVCQLHCAACDDDFTLNEAVAYFARQSEQWQEASRWIEAAPMRSMLSLKEGAR